ncbi:MAG: hypothetical protein NUK65_05660 [Firmicutes bacterium]|nr:hypothetical protein [Bacillota bacterium]
MDAFEQKYKEKLKQTLADVTLPSDKKEALRASMMREIEVSRKSGWQQFRTSCLAFWESTYEISLAPVAVSVCILLVVVGVKYFSVAPDAKPLEPTYFIRQTDAGLEITRLENFREDR